MHPELPALCRNRLLESDDENDEALGRAFAMKSA